MKHMSPQPLVVAAAQEGQLYAHVIGSIHQGSFQVRNKVLWAGKIQVEKERLNIPQITVEMFQGRN